MLSRLSKVHFGDAERPYRSMKTAIATALAIQASATNEDFSSIYMSYNGNGMIHLKPWSPQYTRSNVVAIKR
jgi:hypothetical protein